jgi:hypothetical protein
MFAIFFRNTEPTLRRPTLKKQVEDLAQANAEAKKTEFKMLQTNPKLQKAA